MKRTFLVVYEKGPKNYSGFSPDIPGCGSMGDTLEEMRANLTEAIDLYIDGCIEFGEPLPEPTAKSITLPLEGEADPHAEYVVEWLTVNIPTVTENPATQEQQAA